MRKQVEDQGNADGVVAFEQAQLSSDAGAIIGLPFLGQLAQRFNSLGRVERLGAGINAVENRMAAINTVTAGNVRQPLGRSRIAWIQYAQESL